MSSFLERFQHKTSTLGKEGQIQLDSSNAINPSGIQPTPIAPQKSSIISSGSTIVSNFGRFNQTATTQFARPIRLSSSNSVYSSYDQALLLKDTQSENLQLEKAVATPSTEIVPVDGREPEVEQQQVTIYKVAEPSLHTLYEIPETKRTLTAVKKLKPPIPRRPKPKVTQSTSQPLRRLAQEEKEAPSPPPRPPRRQVDYKPYTLAEYKEKHANRKLNLGGLGASNIGTKEWSSAKSLYDKRKIYAREVQSSNQTRLRLGISPNTTARQNQPEYNSAYIFRQRALEFARGISRPKLKVPVKAQIEIEPDDDPLQQRKFLEEEHLKYLRTLEELKAKMDLCQQTSQDTDL